MGGISFCPNCEFGDLGIPCWVSVTIRLCDSWTVQEDSSGLDDVVFSEFVSGTERTLFRTNNGFSIISENEVIRR